MKEKIALVTGGSRGIGAAIVRCLAHEGAKVYFTYRTSETEARELEASLKGEGPVKGLACDSKERQQVDAVVQEILDTEDRLDILVNNAGIVRDGLFASMEDEDWKEVLDTNLGGVYFFSKAVLRTMIRQRQGTIVNMSSVVAQAGGYGQANYAASKGAVNAFTRSLALELASRNINVNAVAPGMVNTRMSEPVRSVYGDKIKERIPLGRFAEPEAIASVVAFLASDEAKYITGQIITADGGLSLIARH